MNLFSLNIYGANDEIVKVYETNHCPWGLFIKAAKLQEELKGKKEFEQIMAIGELIKVLFVGLTDEELYQADAKDIMNLFSQLINKGNGINGKNA